MEFVFICLGTVAALLVGAGLLHLLPRLGNAGKATSGVLSRAPGLDGVVTYFILVPLVIGPVLAGWLGFGGAIVGQILAMAIWTVSHELAHPEARRGPRIVKVLNRIVGRWPNHAALWVMAPAAPLFCLVRLTQWLIYPPLILLVGLPRYRTGEWVNISRQKFDGLVGHDLIWCLYCDWMTGLWSLGSEMLRNIESLWCPIRFDSQKKCENCRQDFPDVEGSSTSPPWVDSEGSMAEVADLLDRQYAEARPRSWYQHPVRLTVQGQQTHHDTHRSMD